MYNVNIGMKEKITVNNSQYWSLSEFSPGRWREVEAVHKG